MEIVLVAAIGENNVIGKVSGISARSRSTDR